LEKRLGQLAEQISQNSRNSHLPPSSDTPEERRKRKNQEKKARQARKRGGQPGHPGAHRELVPPEKVSKFVDLFPAECESCWKSLPAVPDALATRYQQTEVPPIEPRTTEWRRHQVSCPCCGYKTRAAYAGDQIPASPFGPRLMAIMALLTGVYHLGRRRAVELLSDIVGVRVSLGALSAVEARVSCAVQPCVDEAWDRVRAADVKHTDGTSWYQGGVTMALWTLAASGVTVFKILANSAKSTLRPLYGALNGILVSDRAKALNFWAIAQRQICWAHFAAQIHCVFRAGRSERDVREKVARLHWLGLRLLARLQAGQARPRHVRALARPGTAAARSCLGGRRLGRRLRPVRVLRGHPRAPTSPVDLRRPSRRRAD